MAAAMQLGRLRQHGRIPVTEALRTKWQQRGTRWLLEEIVGSQHHRAFSLDWPFEDQVSLLDRYALSVDERQALRSFDIGKLYRMGVHGLILRPFTLLHEVSEPDYLKAIRG
jgi:hypothetical protein